MKIKKREILERVFLLEFDTQYELAATFLRFQEHYESPRFRGRIFTLEAFMDWYAREYSSFTYYQDWGGFNIPAEVLKPFYAGSFDPLLDKEKHLLRLFHREKGNFYVLGMAREGRAADRITLEHELAHALFHTRPDYRREVLATLNDYDTGALEKKLIADGYHRKMLKDEVHAYLLTEPHGSAAARRRLTPLRRRLRKLYREHSERAALPRRRAPGGR